MAESIEAEEAEELFVNQAAHLFLALAGAKPLPKLSNEEGVIEDLLKKRKKS